MNDHRVKWRNNIKVLVLAAITSMIAFLVLAMTAVPREANAVIGDVAGAAIGKMITREAGFSDDKNNSCRFSAKGDPFRDQANRIVFGKRKRAHVDCKVVKVSKNKHKNYGVGKKTLQSMRKTNRKLNRTVNKRVGTNKRVWRSNYKENQWRCKVHVRTTGGRYTGARVYEKRWCESFKWRINYRK